MNPESIQQFDLIVIGGGPAGASGAAAAGFLGKHVALVEKTCDLGGAGINTGTIPSKTLRETALALSGWRSRRLFGVDLSLRRAATIGEFMGHQQNVIAAERDRSEARLAARGVARFTGSASFVDPHLIRIVQAGGTEILLRGEKILIATGSSPLRPAEFCFSDDRVHDSDEILLLEAMPKKLVVIGGGVIGSEYAGTFASLGVETHLVDGRDTLMPFLDPEISRTLASAMAENGVQFHWKERVTSCDATKPGEVVLTLSSGATLSCDGVLVCAGRKSNTDDLNLAAAGIAPGNRGLIPVNGHYQSAVPHIYAAGDVVGPPALAATGIEQARVAVSDAFGSTFKSDLATLLPTGIYTIPEASMIGETEASLREKGIEFVVGRARYCDLPRGEIIGDQTGFLKLIFRQGDMRLLGVHIIGEQATELVHVGLIAMLAEAGAEIFNRACFNYPTLGDLYKYAAYDALAKSEQPQMY
ncbi:Si-specific NAD(P)(+) transhydrogenase [Luteolibacter arcticus]|uniref:Soluble pyridine nucleotide transhydrogenase n=1 Tax=Luteolibacter arcticus TaxID=1581411 RepID=A0ABT3GJY6_9BACT|nr:Si-specific NAD(P)(+) transhydrogenase [Luteolibacter arcticus]MCW1923838.1 Si-specific NAD(P)(+) transhydrogenase [Luteolibacter arcticus]